MDAAREAVLHPEGVLRIKVVCVPRMCDLTRLIMEEVHSSRYFIHLGAVRMYNDLNQHYWWCRTKRGLHFNFYLDEMSLVHMIDG